MKKKLAAWQLIRDSLERNIPVMLLYVLESVGSSPGRQGFFMTLALDGKREGSIGGGIMEHKLVEMAMEQLRSGGNERQTGGIKKQIHDKAAAKNQSGMICSGEQTVLLCQVQDSDRESIRHIVSTLFENKNGTIELSLKGITFSDKIPEQQFYFSGMEQSDWQYRERLGYQDHLYIIGGGHCALALSSLMSTLDFYIHLFDNREDLLTMNVNDFVHEKKVIPDYEELASYILPGKNSYVVIMTSGYRTDDIATKALFGTDFRYVGLMGSKKKIQKMFNDYRKSGVEERLLQQIHAPVGLSIKSETPEEIAVSIAAQIIQVKNGPAPA